MTHDSSIIILYFCFTCYKLFAIKIMSIITQCSISIDIKHFDCYMIHVVLLFLAKQVTKKTVDQSTEHFD